MDIAREELNQAFSPGRAEFLAAAEAPQKPLLIPVFCEIDLPGITPTDLFDRLRNDRGFLLESLEGSDKVARYSCIGLAPQLILSVDRSGRIDPDGNPQFVEIIASAKGKTPLASVREAMQRFSIIPSRIPRFSGGMAGYVCYDLVYSLFETFGEHATGGEETPVACFMFARDCMVFDHRERRLYLVSHALVVGGTDPTNVYEESMRNVLAMQESVRALEEKPAECHAPDTPLSFSSSVSKEAFMQAVRRIKEHISAGDIFQAVLSRRLACPFTGDPFAVYRALRESNPSPYMYYLDYGNPAIAGSSPEMLVRVENGRVTTVPIAGTRPRGRTDERDRQLAQELLHDEKERAEHIMLVDLARNDVGSVCKYGSVGMDEFMGIEKFSHVQHIVSTVSGTLRDGIDCFDVLAACFPAGTVSGAPKLRAMQIIDAMEGSPRGIYAGAVGYLGFDGALDLAITIRTVVVSDGMATIQVGAGIVADSDPESEWYETESKGKAMMRALSGVNPV